MGEIREEYNQLLAKFWKAYAYLEDNSILLAERQKWEPEYLRIIKRLSAILVELRKRGIYPTHEQVLEGL